MRIDLFYGWHEQVPVESYPIGKQPDHFIERPEASERGTYLLDYRLRYDIHNWLIARGEVNYAWGFDSEAMSQPGERKGITMWIALEQDDSALLFKLTWGGAQS